MNTIIKSAIIACSLGMSAITANHGMADTQKSIAVGLLEKGLMQADREFIKQHVREDYRQHNPQAPDGLAGLLGFVDYLETLNPPLKVKPVRVLSEGNLVVVHSEYDFFGPKVIFDLFRFEDGKLAEHWDSMQEVPETTVSGRTMTDGAVEITDLDKTAENKALVVSLVTDVLMHGKIEKIDDYIAVDYRQHNPFVADGRDGLKGFIAYLTENKIQFGYSKLHNVVAEGNFVFTQSEGTYEGKPTAYYDLFRVENGMIVEHWDAVQEIPEKMAHDNGMF